MDDARRLVVYVGAYDGVLHALRDLDELEQLHERGLVGGYDAAVVDMERGRPHIARTVDHPRVLAVPERLGAGPLPREAVKEAAKRLSGHDAALIVLGTPAIAEGLKRALTRATKVARHDFDETPDVLGTTLVEAFRS
jgi:hypothetical protein